MNHLITVSDLSRDRVDILLSLAGDFEMAMEQGRALPQLRGKSMGYLFLEPSTRTKTSFQLAAGKLGIQTIAVGSECSALAKGESFVDTVKTLAAYQLDCLVVRSPFIGAAHMAAKVRACPVINAGDGSHEHPTQALADVFVLRQHYPDMRGLEVWMVGDVVHSRVARSVIGLLQTLGATVVLCGPPHLVPAPTVFDCPVVHSLEEIASASVIYVLRPQQERMTEQGDYFSPREYQRSFRLGQGQLSAHQLVLHPGPINRGLEITSDLADHPQCRIAEQVRAGLLVRTALVYYLLK